MEFKTIDQIRDKVFQIVSEQLGLDQKKMTIETHFINDLNTDSLDTVELVMEFEDVFGVFILDEEAQAITTVGQAIDIIAEKLRVKKPA